MLSQQGRLWQSEDRRNKQFKTMNTKLINLLFCKPTFQRALPKSFLTFDGAKVRTKKIPTSLKNGVGKGLGKMGSQGIIEIKEQGDMNGGGLRIPLTQIR